MSTSPHSAPTDDLSRLVETEQRLAERLAAAEEDARRIVEEAREAAGEAERALAAELTGSLETLRREAESERDRRIAATEAEARAQVARLDGLPPERIENLADLVVERLLALVGQA